MSMQTYKKRTADSLARRGTAAQDNPLSGGMPSLVDGASRKDLPEAIRTKMENAFGADFSNLNIYESEKVAEGGARAVTQGNTIAFAPGQFNVYSPSSEALLGHELSHVVSQARGESRGNGLLSDSYLEAKADREGVMAAAGQQVYSGPITPLSNSTPMSVAGPMQCKTWGLGKLFGGKKKQPNVSDASNASDVKTLTSEFNLGEWRKNGQEAQPSALIEGSAMAAPIGNHSGSALIDDDFGSDLIDDDFGSALLGNDNRVFENKIGDMNTFLALKKQEMMNKKAENFDAEDWEDTETAFWAHNLVTDETLAQPQMDMLGKSKDTIKNYYQSIYDRCLNESVSNSSDGDYISKPLSKLTSEEIKERINRIDAEAGEKEGEAKEAARKAAANNQKDLEAQERQKALLYSRCQLSTKELENMYFEGSSKKRKPKSEELYNELQGLLSNREFREHMQYKYKLEKKQKEYDNYEDMLGSKKRKLNVNDQIVPLLLEAGRKATMAKSDYTANLKTGFEPLDNKVMELKNTLSKKFNSSLIDKEYRNKTENIPDLNAKMITDFSDEAMDDEFNITDDWKIAEKKYGKQAKKESEKYRKTKLEEWKRNHPGEKVDKNVKKELSDLKDQKSRMLIAKYANKDRFKAMSKEVHNNRKDVKEKNSRLRNKIPKETWKKLDELGYFNYKV